jgi:hypothetical protein
LTDLSVRPVRTTADLRRFIALPYALHRGDPHWVPPLRMDVRKMLDRKKNPFFHRAEAEYFTAERRNGGTAEVVGRIAAIQNRAHNEFHGDQVGFFGFFECVNDQAVADALFSAAAPWLRARGLDTMRGPASFSTNDECGLLVNGFDTPPTLLNPHNPPYYVDLLERAGFVKVIDMFQYQLRNPQLPERLVRGARLLAERKKITLHQLDMRRWDEAIETIKAIYNSAWEKNWGFVPMADAEVDYLAAQLKPVVVPELVVFCKQDGKTIGFAAALPDLNVALKTNPSGRLFPGVLKILWAARKVTRIRIWALGLLQEYRMSGADALMYHWIWEKGYALGHRWAEAGWILEDNTAMNNGLLRMGFEPYKTLRFYDRPLT